MNFLPVEDLPVVQGVPSASGVLTMENGINCVAEHWANLPALSASAALLAEWP
jgi:hypothetical protein